METYHSRPETPMTAEKEYMSEITRNTPYALELRFFTRYCVHTPYAKRQEQGRITDSYPRIIKYLQGYPALPEMTNGETG
jgi:hypothetical protein